LQDLRHDRLRRPVLAVEPPALAAAVLLFVEERDELAAPAAAGERMAGILPAGREPREEILGVPPLSLLPHRVARPAQLGDPHRLSEVRRVAPRQGPEVLPEPPPDHVAPLVVPGVGVDGDDVDEPGSVPFGQGVLLQAPEEADRLLARIAARRGGHHQRAGGVLPDRQGRVAQVVGVSGVTEEGAGPGYRPGT
jgi:hypothetical protein